jgi:hypothetical protein
MRAASNRNGLKSDYIQTETQTPQNYSKPRAPLTAQAPNPDRIPGHGNLLIQVNPKAVFILQGICQI